MARHRDLYDPSLAGVEEAKAWLRAILSRYSFGVKGIYLTDGTVMPLPDESSLIAKLIEVTLLEKFRTVAHAVKGLEVLGAPSGRDYPDILLTGDRLANRKVALDVKTARRNRNGDATSWPITLGPWDKYFRNPDQKMRGCWIPYGDIEWHLALIVLYDYVGGSVENVEPLVVEKWRVASRQESSGTRNYIGAVKSVAALHAEKGAFATEEEFNAYWRVYERRRRQGVPVAAPPSRPDDEGDDQD